MNKITITDHGGGKLSYTMETRTNRTILEPSPKRTVALTLAHAILAFKGKYEIVYKDEEK